MISAQTDQVVQEHLIEKYMLLPNQVRNICHHIQLIKVHSEVLVLNVVNCFSGVGQHNPKSNERC